VSLCQLLKLNDDDDDDLGLYETKAAKVKSKSLKYWYVLFVRDTNTIPLSRWKGMTERT